MCPPIKWMFSDSCSHRGPKAFKIKSLVGKSIFQRMDIELHLVALDRVSLGLGEV